MYGSGTLGFPISVNVPKSSKAGGAVATDRATASVREASCSSNTPLYERVKHHYPDILRSISRHLANRALDDVWDSIERGVE